MKIDFRKDDIGLWVVCVALEADTPQINKMQMDEDGCFEVRLICGGVELDFSKVCKRIDEIYDQAVEKRAGEMYLDAYDRRADKICEELDGIAARLREIRETKFPKGKWDDYYECTRREGC